MSEPLLLRTIRRESTRRRPVRVLRQAGCYLSEHQALRKGRTFKEPPQSADLAAEVTMLRFKRYQLDAAIVFADIMSPLPALGAEFDSAPGPVVPSHVCSDPNVAALAAADGAEFAPRSARSTPHGAWRNGRRQLHRALAQAVGTDPETPGFLPSVRGGGCRFTAGSGRPPEA